MTAVPSRVKAGTFLQLLRCDRSGLAMLEFALSLPFFLAFGLFTIDLTRLSLAHLKVSQIALNLADNISRMGTTTQVQQLREVDVNDAFEAVRDQGAPIQFTARGRIILSSLENGVDGQRIHWQRCVGMKSGAGYDSGYGNATPYATAGSYSSSVSRASTPKGLSVPTGMGETGARVLAPPSSGVMFVEANYEFRPLFGSMFGWTSFGNSRIHYLASFIVRDNRDFGATAAVGMPLLMNPNPAATRATCDLYTT
jgi:hypothetical protein